MSPNERSRAGPEEPKDISATSQELAPFDLRTDDASSGHLSAILDASTDGLIVYDRDGNVVAINATARAILGYREGLLKSTLNQRISASELRRPDGTRLAADELPTVRALRGERVERMEMVFARRGEQRIIVTGAAPVYSPSKEITGAVVTLRDITDRVAARQERQRLLADVDAERRQVAQLAAEAQRQAGELNAIIESIADAVFVCDSQGVIVKANSAGIALVGTRQGEGTGSLADYLQSARLRFADGRAVPVKSMAITKALHGQVVRGMEELAVHPSGKEIALLSSAAPLRDDNGAIVGAVEVVADITQVRDLAGEAQRRAAELEAVLDNMFDAVLVADNAGDITLANESAVRLFGFRSRQEARRPINELPSILRMRHSDGRPLLAPEMPLARAIAGELVEQEDHIIVDLRTGHDCYVRTSAAPIRGAQGMIVGAVEVARDVTELTELERLKDEFIAVAAHELKTPVAIMKGYAQALLRSCNELPTTNRKMLDAINRGSDRIDRIVQDLLDISRLRIGHLELAAERIDLAELAAEVVDRFALTTQQHQIRLGDVEHVAIVGDRDRLEQVFVNLLDNAIKYSPKGGEVVVGVAARGDEAIVGVRDKGIGIPADKQSQVFQRFYRAHAGTPHDYAGMGVGLYISNEIVRRHRGRMWFKSVEGSGSAFYFGLPFKRTPRRESRTGVLQDRLSLE